MPNKPHPLIVEAEVRAAFNAANRSNAEKRRLLMPGGQARHEFDMYHAGQLVGGISTSPWRNEGRRTCNTAGQDRASTELFWLSLWDGPERRVHVLTDEEMAEKLYRRYRDIPMKVPIELHYYSLPGAIFSLVGTLGA